jgi:transcription elongation GreA/GreB family factor
MDRARVIDAIVARLQEDLSVLVRSAQAAHAAATHEESKAEDAHDTRGLEASYLAGAQAKRVLELERQIAAFKQFSRDPLPQGSGVRVGACVEVETAGRRSYYFVSSQGGGLAIQQEGLRVQVITPFAPLGEALIGRRSGDRITLESEQGEREYWIRQVW